MVEKLTALEQFEQAVNRCLHMIRPRVRFFVQPTLLSVLLASFFILGYCNVQAAPAEQRGHVDKSIERVGIDFDDPVGDISALAPQLIPYGVDNGIVFPIPVAPGGKSVIGVGPEQEPDGTPKADYPRACNPNGENIINHWSALFGIIMMFLSVLAGGLCADAARHGYKDTAATLIGWNSLIMPRGLIMWSRNFKCKRDGVSYEDSYSD